MIGYSKYTDVAVIYVHELEGLNPYPIETNNSNLLGKEVIAFGSPSGHHNIASKGYIIGKKSDLHIDTYIYKDLYKISSPIFSGSSGGPLVCRELGKIVAINTAKKDIDSTVGFSIPLYKVIDLIQSWINQPMSEQTILSEFDHLHQDIPRNIYGYHS